MIMGEKKQEKKKEAIKRTHLNLLVLVEVDKVRQRRRGLVERKLDFWQDLVVKIKVWAGFLWEGEGGVVEPSLQRVHVEVAEEAKAKEGANTLGEVHLDEGTIKELAELTRVGCDVLSQGDAYYHSEGCCCLSSKERKKKEKNKEKNKEKEKNLEIFDEMIQIKMI